MTQQDIAPVQGYSAGIPWSLHLRAWDAYAKRWGSYQSAERLAERGGFGTSELDEFVPGWRDEVSEITSLRAEIERLTAHQNETALAWTKLTESQEAEIERLRAALKPTVDAKNALSAVLDNYGTVERWLNEQFLPAAAAAEVALLGTEQLAGD